MIVAIGSDHAGFKYKESLKKHLTSLNVEVLDEGASSITATDYPDYAFKVSKRVVDKQADFGILVCGTGIGMSIAANKVKGIRAALVNTAFTADSAKTHNHANVIAFGARTNTIEEVINFTNIFMNTKNSDQDRHINRVKKITEYEVEEWEK
ncbi:ribose 5-phosphate isomerase B [Mycoplasmatota bacterium WC30]